MSNERTDTPPAARSQSSNGDILPFTVEFADDYCRNFTITTPPLSGSDVRGRWDTARLSRRPQRMRDLGTTGNRIPSPIPGAMLEIDVRRKHVRLFDPLKETEAGREVLAEYNRVASTTPALKKDCIGFTAVEFDVDDDQLKTLLLEILRKKDSKCIDMITGTLPTAEQVNRLPGHELYDPSNPGDDKPRYKKDLQAWKERQRGVMA